jgi:hypothetical protein
LRKGVLKNKANLSRIEYCVMRIAKRSFKKQSQFTEGQIGVKSYLKGNYGNKPVSGVEENKANLSRIEYCVMRIAKRNFTKQSQLAGLSRPVA